jgi:pimeloyl-ACP methyl ester carboxylesterase
VSSEPLRFSHLLLTALIALQLKDTPSVAAARGATSALQPPRTACEGNRGPLPNVLAFALRAGAFPGSGNPDVAVHVPRGFDATRRPGLVLYFHGWNGCVATALGEEDAPCIEGGDVRPASRLAAQIDEARVNALLVAVELSIDQTTGDPGQLAMPGDLRDLLRELFSEHLAETLGCTLDTEQLDRVVVVAHSGGYQAAADALRYGQVLQIGELDLLDALYGADDVFSEWARDAAATLDVPRRFVDLYTTGGGTLDRSRALAAIARGAAGAYADRVYDDDRNAELAEGNLARPVVFKRVKQGHSELPEAYLGVLLRAAGFAPVTDK